MQDDLLGIDDIYAAIEIKLLLLQLLLSAAALCTISIKNQNYEARVLESMCNYQVKSNNGQQYHTPIFDH